MSDQHVTKTHHEAIRCRARERSFAEWQRTMWAHLRRSPTPRQLGRLAASDLKKIRFVTDLMFCLKYTYTVYSSSYWSFSSFAVRVVSLLMGQENKEQSAFSHRWAKEGLKKWGWLRRRRDFTAGLSSHEKEAQVGLSLVVIVSLRSSWFYVE